MRAALFAICCLAALAVEAQVYKWVDEKGRTHYSETPPPDKKDAKKVDTGPAVSPAPAPREDWKQKELDARKRNLERQQADDASRRKEAHEEQVQKGRCRSAQRELQVLQMEAPLFHVNEKGEKVYLEDRERPAAIARARKEVETYCK